MNSSENLIPLLKQYAGFFVYVWKRGEEYLYIGQSRQLLGRLTSHSTVGVVEPFQDGDTIYAIRCATAEEMTALELRMIKEHRPKYDRTLGSKKPTHTVQRQRSQAALAAKTRNIAAEKAAQLHAPFSPINLKGMSPQQYVRHKIWNDDAI